MILSLKICAFWIRKLVRKKWPKTTQIANNNQWTPPVTTRILTLNAFFQLANRFSSRVDRTKWSSNCFFFGLFVDFLRSSHAGLFKFTSILRCHEICFFSPAALHKMVKPWQMARKHTSHYNGHPNWWFNQLLINFQTMFLNVQTQMITVGIRFLVLEIYAQITIATAQRVY